MKTYIRKDVFITAMMATTDAKDYRENLKHIWIEHDAENKVLTVVGTNAQEMIISKIKLTDPEQNAFCEKVFDVWHRGYKLPETVLKSKSHVLEFEQLESGQLLCDGGKVEIWDGTMPDYRQVIPKKELVGATQYCAFNPDLIKKVDKALGNKKSTIVDTRPLVSSADETEYLTPHLWNTADEQDFQQLVVVMPIRFDR